MNQGRKQLSRSIVLPSIIAIAAGVLAVVHLNMDTAEAQRIAEQYFTGGGPMLIDSDDVNTARVRVDAGSRSHWHSHTWGQLLLLEEGRGRIQFRGQSVREMRPGEPVFTEGNVEHWHGAAPDESMVMLSTSGRGAEWAEPVDDALYHQQPQ